MARQVITRFYDKVQSVSSGYASFDYEFVGYRRAPLVKLDVRLALSASSIINPCIVPQAERQVDRRALRHHAARARGGEGARAGAPSAQGP